MDDERIWAFEESLWTGDAGRYHELIDDECLMVVPAPPFVLRGREAADAVSDTPRWSSVSFSEKQVSRPQEGIIVIAYKADAQKEGGEAYTAHCTTVMRRLEHEVWRVIQHQQTPPLVSK
ncbi:nuclear transport factor 2 family protein [Enterovirga sp. CN4-39]|uniref:nuclear transport factor 2 family protein n=1 Tax=Enterovirga sp. CN4-39 TaxID=3400910 RepID=UPI003C008176